MRFAVGDRWRYVAPNGDIGNVWLHSNDSGFDVWFYDFQHADGSGHTSDWATSRRIAVELCSVQFHYHKNTPRPRFARHKAVEGGSQDAGR